MKKLFAAVAMFGTIFVPITQVLAGDAYLTLGVGHTDLRQVRLNDWWYQNEYAHTEQSTSNAYSVGAGRRLNRYLAAEIDYRDLGAYHADAMFTPSDAAYFSGCVATNTCPATAMLHAYGTVRAIAPSVILSWPGTVSPFLRVGELFYRSTWQVHASVPQYSQYSYLPPDAGTPGAETKQGVRPF